MMEHVDSARIVQVAELRAAIYEVAERDHVELGDIVLDPMPATALGEEAERG